MVAFLCADGDDIGNRYTILASSINFRRSNDSVEKRKKKEQEEMNISLKIESPRGRRSSFPCLRMIYN